MTGPMRTFAELHTDVQATLGHRCRDDLCLLNAGDHDTYTVVLATKRERETDPLMALSMCNDCVIDTRRSVLAADIESIRLTRRHV